MSLTPLFDRIVALFRRKRVEDDLDDEIQTHIEMATEENLRRGMNLADARFAARRSFGGIEQIKEAHREGRGFPALEAIVKDLQFALRSLRNKPGFAAATVMTLALGIGSCTIVFSVINAVLLTSLPYPDPEQLVFASGRRGSETSAISPLDFLDYRKRNRSFSELAAMTSSLIPMTLTGIPEPKRVQVAPASGNFFDVFEARPILGRSFTLEDERGATVAVISHALWQSRYGGRENIIGDVLHLDGNALSVIGVLSPGFRFAVRPDVWIPLQFSAPEFQSRGAHQLLAVGRLKKDASITTAQQEMDVLAAGMEKAYPDTNKGFGVRIVPLQQELVGFLESPLMIVMAAVGLLLLLACANVANLILARGTTRKRELATRMALGAGRARVIRLLLSEALILAFAGGTFGTLIALWIVPLFAPLSAELLPGV
jgi:putative ABC transport system permease protein